MELQVLENTLPLKAFPPKSLDKTLETTFMFWIANLLSLKADKKESVLIALPEIKYHFHSLGLKDVKKAFEMYARGQLSIKPISNYFDIVLVGQIFQEYKATLPRKKPKKEELSDEEKKDLISKGMKRCLDYWEKEQKIADGYILFLYDTFYDDGFLPTDKESKLKAMENAKSLIEINYIGRKPKNLKERDKIKEVLEDIKDPKSALVIKTAKELMVNKFLRETFKDEKLVNDLKKKYEVRHK